jgi:hypothetical protein
MEQNLTLSCGVHSTPEGCPDVLISYFDKFREYGLFLHDGGSSSIDISYCPWCGAKLPHLLRERWFKELAALGFDDPSSQEIPERFRTGAWYE